MIFEGNQKRYINSKSTGTIVIKGEEHTGKTTAALYKAIKIKNNYCIFQEDKIVIISDSIEKCKEAENIYEKAKEETDLDYLTLFSMDSNRVYHYTLDNLVEAYSRRYIKSRNKVLSLASRAQLLEAIKKAIDQYSIDLNKYKSFRNSEIEFFLDEILWIKSGAFTEEEYQMIDRKGREKRLRKNSTARSLIYSIYKLYERELDNMCIYDNYDPVLFAIKACSTDGEKFTHIILDNAEKLTRAEILFIKKLCKDEPYSTFTCIIEKNILSEGYNWIRSGRNITNLIGNNRTFLFKNKFKVVKEEKTLSSLQSYIYVDFKNKRNVTFLIDTAASEQEILVEQGSDIELYSKSELTEIPMYSDIAAGEPILISDEEASNFYLPKLWFKGSKDTFMLHVKGDSMKNADINDGDLIIMRKQSTASHNDIVAVDIDGSATLKRLNLKGNYPVLIPENPKYDPISLEDKEAAVIGIAIGVIKQN